VNQAELAASLKVSRVPVREALATLHAEGILDYKPNTGFTVARFNRDDLGELYLLRQLLETELICSIDLAMVDVETMAALNAQMKDPGLAVSSGDYQQLNRRFHFTLFDCSPLKLIRSEVSRLWSMSNFYHALYLFESESWEHLDDDHGEIVEAVRSADVERLIRACDEHRDGTERLISPRLRPRG
jgi:DNA-binding GntR family transcriptional regulator